MTVNLHVHVCPELPKIMIKAIIHGFSKIGIPI